MSVRHHIHFDDFLNGILRFELGLFCYQGQDNGKQLRIFKVFVVFRYVFK